MRLYEKYRPKTLEEVVGQENAKKQIEIALRSGWGGKAYWISGASGTGKTTLTRILGQRFGYLTDETVGLDPVTRWITPYPKPLSLRTREGGFPKREEGPDGLGLLPAHPAPVLTSLILIRRDPAVTGPRKAKRRISLMEAT